MRGSASRSRSTSSRGSSSSTRCTRRSTTSFASRSEQVAESILSSGGIVVAAGHDHEMLARICTRAVLMRGGRIEDDGDFVAVRAEYLRDP